METKEKICESCGHFRLHYTMEDRGHCIIFYKSSYGHCRKQKSGRRVAKDKKACENWEKGI